MTPLVASRRAGATTTTISSNSPDARAAAMDQHTTGSGPSSAVTLSSPRRVEPPAARMAAAARPSLMGATDASRSFGLGPLRLREDHATTHGLQDAHDRDGEVGADVPSAVLDHDHRAVLEIADALLRFLALLHDA